jgi:RNA polymerase sigma factor (sigma-70 family)
MDVDVKDYFGAAIKLAQKHGARFPIADSEEFSQGLVGLAQAKNKCPPNVNFLTYAWPCIENSIKRIKEYKRRTKRNKPTVHLAKEPHISEANKVENNELAEMFLSILNPKYRGFVEKKFLGNYTYRQIAKESGCSAEYVSQEVLKAIIRMRKVKVNGNLLIDTAQTN